MCDIKCDIFLCFFLLFKDLILPFSELNETVPDRLVLPFLFFKKELLRFTHSQTNESGQLTIFFLFDEIFRGYQEGPLGEGIKVFHSPIGREMIKTLTLFNLASKSRFYYIRHFGPIFRTENPVDVSTLIF